MDRRLRSAIVVWLLAAFVAEAATTEFSLIEAVKKRKQPHFERILTAGADLGAVDTDGRTALWHAAAVGNAGFVQTLARCGADVDVPDTVKGWTPLIAAAAGRSVGAVEVLVRELGADVEAIDFEGETALVKAAAGHPDWTIVKTLIEAGADVNAADARGATLLFPAATAGRTEIVREALERGAEVNAANAQGTTALMWATGHPETLGVLLDAGADVRPRSDDGYDALSFAAKMGYSDAVRMLLAAGAPIDAADDGGRTALSRAVQANQPATVAALLEAGADPDVWSTVTQTPLIQAVTLRRIELVRLLTEHGADPTIGTEVYPSPLRAVASQGRVPILEMFLSQDSARGAMGEALWAACAACQGDAARFLVDKGADPSRQNVEGRSPIVLAIRSKCDEPSDRLDLVRFLLDKGANPNLVGSRGWTPILEAAHQGHPEVVKLLLRRGADAKAVTSVGVGVVPLHVKHACSDHSKLRSVLSEWRASVRELLEDGVDMSGMDQQQKQAATQEVEEFKQLVAAQGKQLKYDVARRWNDGCAGQVRLLLKAGADPNSRGNYGRSALAIAEDNDRKAVARLLRSNGALAEVPSVSRGEELVGAVHGKDVAAVRALLVDGTDPDTRDGGGETPLVRASRFGALEIVDLLLAHGADPGLASAGYGEETPLEAALEMANRPVAIRLLATGVRPSGRALLRAIIRCSDLVQRLIESGAEMTEVDGVDRPALMTAAMLGKDDAVTLLLDHGADIETTDRRGATALSVAAGAGHSKTAGILLERGARLNPLSRGETTPLIEAINAGNNDLVKLFLRGSADIDLRTIRGESALHWAVSKGHLEICRSLIAAGADVNLPNRQGMTPLMLAASAGHDLVADALIAAGANVDSRRWSLSTALTMAAGGGEPKVMQILLDAGAGVGTRGSYGGTSLHAAARSGCAECVTMLLAAGAEVDTRTWGGRVRGLTALMIAAEQGHAAPVNVLLAAEADPTLQSSRRKTASEMARSKGHLDVAELIAAASSVPAREALPSEVAADSAGRRQVAAPCTGKWAEPLFKAIGRRNLDEVKAAVAEGVSILQRSDGLTPLMEAALRRAPDIVSYLLEQGSEIDAVSDGRMSALMYAVKARKQHVKQDDRGRAIVDILLDRGAATDLQNRTEQTALLIAVDQDDPEKVKALLESDADPEISDGHVTPLGLAIREVRPRLVRLLLDNNARLAQAGPDQSSGYLYAGRSGSMELIDMVLAAPGAEAGSVIVGAAAAGKTDVVLSLLERGLSVDSRDGDGRTGLMAAYFRKDMMELLLARGANPNARDHSGQTALMMVVAGARKLDLIDLLCESGADVDARDAAGRTALIRAVGARSPDAATIKALLRRGADPSVVDDKGDSASALANRGYRKEIKALLN